ncbi:hypothetical protein E3A20_25790, partial [Planctomyces bekefii]
KGEELKIEDVGDEVGKNDEVFKYKDGGIESLEGGINRRENVGE